MARIRTIKPEFPQSESMGLVSREARLCFILLWTVADDSGRLRGNSRMLASLLYPYDRDAGELIEQWLSELEKENCLVRYRISGHSYLEICNWLDHQKIDHASKSKFPPFDESSRIFANPREHSGEDQGSRKGRDHSLVPRSALEEIYSAYPRKVGKEKALKAIEKAIHRIKAEHDHAWLLGQTEAYALTRKGEDQQFTPHPATWFNEGRYDDESLQPKAKTVWADAKTGEPLPEGLWS